MDPIDNIENYRYGVFYYNKADIRAVVPKTSRSFGWTLNFAIWKSWVFIAMLLLIAAAGIIYFR